MLWCDVLPYMKLMPTMPRPTTTIFFLDPAAMVATGFLHTKGRRMSSSSIFEQNKATGAVAWTYLYTCLARFWTLHLRCPGQPGWCFV